MGIFDLFKQKRSPLNELQETKREVKEYVGSLQSVSTKLEEQFNQLEKLQNGDFDTWMEQSQKLLEKRLEETRKRSTMVSAFKPENLNDEEFKDQVRIATMNLGAMNAMIEMDLRDYSSHMNAFNKFCSSTTVSMQQSEQLINALPSLSDKLTELNLKIDSAISSLNMKDGEV